MATSVARMSLEEFLDQRGPTFHDTHELWNGEVVEVPPPTIDHIELQARLEKLLNERCRDRGYTAYREFYVTFPTDARRVDVALISRDRWSSQPRTKVFSGAPELVVEVLSPSNTHMDIDRLRAVCLDHDGLQFWVVNLELRTITTYDRDGSVRLYTSGSVVPLSAFGAATPIVVDEVFGG